MTAGASWYWPFGGSDKGKERLRISELMEPTSELIDEAADLADEGKITEAVGKYNAALRELDRVEAENPERVQSAEFATVRNKRAYINSAIDSLLLRQAQKNAKAVAVTDTTELERRYAELKGKKLPAAKKPSAPPPAAKESAKEEKRPAAEAQKPAVEEPKPVEEQKPAAEDEQLPGDVAATLVDEEKPSAVEEKKPAAALEQPKPVAVAEDPKPAAVAEEKKPAVKEEAPVAVVEERQQAAAKPEPAAANPPRKDVQRRAKLRSAAEALGKRDFVSARRVLAELLAARPNDAAALNLRAAVETEMGDYAAAEETLDKCIQANPDSHYAYYNMVRLFLKTRGEEGKSAAKLYYDAGRKCGGPADPEMEKSLK